MSYSLQGKSVLITAGPTYEAIDPVRFIGNRSSGKMGFALAQAFLNEGARVVLVSGPSALHLQHEHLQLIRVESAQQMLAACSSYMQSYRVAIFAAAVADYRPKYTAKQKIKKKGDELLLELEKTPDILAHFGKHKKNNQLLIGFALETNDEIANAKSKIQRKNLDFIVLNSLQDKGAGFSVDTNKISILDKHNNICNFELKNKEKVAQDILNYLKQNADVF